MLFACRLQSFAGMSLFPRMAAGPGVRLRKRAAPQPACPSKAEPGAKTATREKTRQGLT